MATLAVSEGRSGASVGNGIRDKVEEIHSKETLPKEMDCDSIRKKLKDFDRVRVALGFIADTSGLEDITQQELQRCKSKTGNIILQLK